MNKQNKILLGILAFVVVCTIGYALFSENITINGTATASGDFDIEIDSANIDYQSGVTEPSVIISPDKKYLTFNVTKFNFPGAYVEYGITIKNMGSINAILESINVTGIDNTGAIRYYTDIEDNVGKILTSGSSKKVYFEIEWDENQNISKEEKVTVTLNLNYRQLTNLEDTCDKLTNSYNNCLQNYTDENCSRFDYDSNKVINALDTAIFNTELKQMGCK